MSYAGLGAYHEGKAAPLGMVALLDRDAGEGREGRNAKCWNGLSCRA